MTTRPTRIEVQPECDGGWSVVRDRIVDAHFADLLAANEYADTCARRARRAGMAVTLRTLPAMESVTGAAA